ncbi:SDR family oxidoreductase [Novosphingobium sp. PASSN1]|uniref:SDR family NAD(P)-dependent oxidoreductase n=1 Tax=Novosphingobium sp. PASSN1 TaxID=2015561 RepID=UPI000BD24E6C|nr:SDR family oxidoreductase [Novosphingobium sp. PASSN1]OYU34703.1 MAG: oxidoreductase [Novosphingobium sp. PASSN1]
MNDTLAAMNGAVALVTGAGNGIGAELAQQLAHGGMKVALVDVDLGAAQKLALRLNGVGGQCLAYQVDVGDPQATSLLAEQVRRDVGPVRMLINNAGVEMLGRGWEISADKWDRIMRINVNGPVNMVRAFLPGMAAHSQPGYVANVCSIGSLISIPMQSAYVASKHALLSYTECLLLDVREAGYSIAVSAVLPGPVRTGIFDTADGADSPASDDHRQQMQEMLLHAGMSADVAARKILEGIFRGDFWISTDPDLLNSAARQRADRLSRLADPAPPGA